MEQMVGTDILASKTASAHENLADLENSQSHFKLSCKVYLILICLQNVRRYSRLGSCCLLPHTMQNFLRWKISDTAEIGKMEKIKFTSLK